jgi:hypothetical protein
MKKDTQAAIAGAFVVRKNRRADRKGDGSSTEKGYFMRAIFGIFPLLIIPVALYNLLAMIAGGPAVTTNELGDVVATNTAPLQAVLNQTFFSLPMISGVRWELTQGDAILLAAIVFLFLEILKSTSTGTSTIINHAISMMLFILCLIEFLLAQNFATSTFFILMSMTLLDVLAGVVVTIVSARRDFGVDHG